MSKRTGRHDNYEREMERWLENQPSSELDALNAYKAVQKHVQGVNLTKLTDRGSEMSGYCSVNKLNRRV